MTSWACPTFLSVLYYERVVFSWYHLHHHENNKSPHHHRFPLHFHLHIEHQLCPTWLRQSGWRDPDRSPAFTTDRQSQFQCCSAWDTGAWTRKWRRRWPRQRNSNRQCLARGHLMQYWGFLVISCSHHFPWQKGKAYMLRWLYGIHLILASLHTYRVCRKGLSCVLWASAAEQCLALHYWRCCQKPPRQWSMSYLEGFYWLASS